VAFAIILFQKFFGGGLDEAFWVRRKKLGNFSIESFLKILNLK
jgi:hypothetical protein